MTRQKSFKRDVRARMAKTGERYTAARRHLVERAERSEPAPAQPLPPAASVPVDFEPPTSEEALLRTTGRGWADWFAVLDDWGATAHTHTEIARWLATNHLDLSGWWVQTITVAYERARGMRQKHQLTSGFSVGASRTIGASPERVFAALVDPSLRGEWLPGVELRERTSRPHRSARVDWPDGSRLVIDLAARAGDRTTISVHHEKLADADRAAQAKGYWRDRLGALKGLLEG
jgi:hypothetical protein